MEHAIRHAIESILFLFIGVPLLVILGGMLLGLLVRWLPSPKETWEPPPAGSTVPASSASSADDSHIGAFLDAMILKQQAQTTAAVMPHDPARTAYLKSMAQTVTPQDHDDMRDLTCEWKERWYELGGKRDAELDPLFREIVDLHWELLKAARADAHQDRLREQQSHYEQAAEDRRRRASHHNSRNIMFGGSVGHARGSSQQSARAREFEDKAAELSREISSLGAPILTAERCRIRLKKIASSLI